MCTLNATEEVDLADELLRIHKWSGMAKFCNLEAKHVWLQFELLEHSPKKITLLLWLSWMA